MAQKTSRRKTKTGKTGQAETIPPSPVPAPIELPEQLRLELTSVMQELLLKTHELSFEYSTCDCDRISECDLANKSRELFKVVKRIHKLVSEMAPPSPRYIK